MMSDTLATSSPPQSDPTGAAASNTLDLSALPPIYVLSTHLDTDALHTVEDDVIKYQGHLTCDAHEGRIFIGQVTQRRRAALELRAIGLTTTVAPVLHGRAPSDESAGATDEPAKKIRRVEVTSHVEQQRSGVVTDDGGGPGASRAAPESGDKISIEEDEVIVISLSWLEASIAAGHPVPFSKYLVYTGTKTSDQNPSNEGQTASRSSGADILARARADLDPDQQQPQKAFSSKSQTSTPRRRGHTAVKLTRQTTGEQDSDQTKDLPEPPDWAKRGSTYSCERSTPDNGPNESSVAELKKIRLARTLTLDEIGVRAYSTSIAAIAAYPYPITDSQEVLRLPGCDAKIAALWVEWQSRDGVIRAAYDAENDSEMRVLRLFYDIWGVGAHTARAFYNRGWRDLDDIVEYGWGELSRVQQIGVKYFDEFQVKIPRAEVEAIAQTIHEHAQRVREPSGVRSVIVGGYRRGKVESGDVDIIVSHLDESQTVDIVQDIVQSLMEEGWVTHELSVSLQSSRRGQATLPFRQGGGGHGFDNLDKALVVWQNPGSEDAAGDEESSNVHRRVDIIVARWSRIGCAVLGWSAGMTFERDIRRYVKHKFKWKFDSSGVRSRVTGEEIDLESVGGPCTTAEEAERKVFAGMGLEYKEPWERCTG